MALPNCTIQISYFDAPDEGFIYFCINRSPSWQVGMDGMILPPFRSRVISLQVAPPSTVAFEGIRISANLDDLDTTSNYLNTTDIVVTPTTFPSLAIVLEDPMPSATTPSLPVRIYYSLGIVVASGETARVIWDEPKIYNPGDD